MQVEKFNRVCPARPSEVRMLGRNLVEQLLDVERKLQGHEQFHAKQEILAHFQRHEPDLFACFESRKISPYQFLVKIQRAFKDQSDVTFCGNIISKNDAVVTLKRYIPNLQYLHDNQLYTDSDTFKELGASVAIGVVATGLIETYGRGVVSNPYLSMETAITLTLGFAVVSFMWFVFRRNRSAFHKAPWNSAVYLGANLQEQNPDNWQKITWKEMEQALDPLKGFTVFKKRPHYEALDQFYFGKSTDPE